MSIHFVCIRNFLMSYVSEYTAVAKIWICLLDELLTFVKYILFIILLVSKYFLNELMYNEED